MTQHDEIEFWANADLRRADDGLWELRLPDGSCREVSQTHDGAFWTHELSEVGPMGNSVPAVCVELDQYAAGVLLYVGADEEPGGLTVLTPQEARAIAGRLQAMADEVDHSIGVRPQGRLSHGEIRGHGRVRTAIRNLGSRSAPVRSRRRRRSDLRRAALRVVTGKSSTDG